MCDLRADGNLMSLSTFNQIRGLTLRPCFMNVCLADGSETKLVGMVKNMMVDIDGFQFEIDVIVAKDKGEQDGMLILGRSLMVTAKALVDFEHKEFFIRSNSYYQCYKVTPPSYAYDLAIMHVDNWETFKALVE